MSLYEYAGLVSIVPLPQAAASGIQDQTSPTRSRDTPPAPLARGRPANGRFRFHSSHPLYATHVQQLRSRFLVPVNVDRPPVPPASDGAVESDAWQRRARKFAEYFLVLLKPWSAVNGAHPGSLTWETFVDFVDQLQNGRNCTMRSGSLREPDCTPFDSSLLPPSHWWLSSVLTSKAHEGPKLDPNVKTTDLAL